MPALLNLPWTRRTLAGALGAGEFVGWGWLAYSFTFMFVILAIGILIVNKVQRNFMDTV